jgi:hypothetical protein
MARMASSLTRVVTATGLVAALAGDPLTYLARWCDAIAECRTV